MFALIFTKRALRSQARQFASFLVSSRTRIDRKVIQHSANVNYSDLINQNYRAYNRPFSNATNESCFLPPLMNIPLIKFPSLFYWYKEFVFNLYVRQTIDKTFNIQEFSTGAQHAIKIISLALALRNYENLQGLVDEMTIEIVKKKVESLASAQRRLITICDKTLAWCANYNMTFKDGRVSDCDFILEISQLGYYVPTMPGAEAPDDLNKRLFISNNGEVSLRMMVYNYTFQRNYKDGIGGPWIATVVNHFSITS